MADHARAVIIGGGVGGTSIAYHLAEPWLDRHRPGRSGRAHVRLHVPLRGPGRPAPPRVTLTRMMMDGADLTARLAAETGIDPAWHEVGSLRLASTPERFEELRRQAGWAKTFGLPLELISAEEAQALFPLMSTDGVLGAVWLPTDGWLDPSGLALALAAGARARAAPRSGTHTRVVAIAVDRGRVTGVEVEHGGERTEIAADVVVNAGGMFAPEIGRLAGVNVPIIPMAHQYLFTEPIEGVHPGLPQMRDPDNLVLLPRGGRRAVHGRLRAPPRAVVARRRAAPTSTASCSRPTGRASPRSWTARSGACRRSPTRGSTG